MTLLAPAPGTPGVAVAGQVPNSDPNLAPHDKHGDLQLLRAVASEPPYDQAWTRHEESRAQLTLHVHRIHRTAVLDLPDLADDMAQATEVWDPEADGGSRALEADLRRLFGCRRTPRHELPDPRPRAAAAVRMLLEVMVGDRPSRQVAGWVSARVLDGLENRSPRQHRSLPRRPILRSLRICEPADGVAEVCAVVETGDRHRAVALRLDGLDGRWTVTALHVG